VKYSAEGRKRDQENMGRKEVKTMAEAAMKAAQEASKKSEAIFEKKLKK
jgi:hypothetical protein